MFKKLKIFNKYFYTFKKTKIFNKKVKINIFFFNNKYLIHNGQKFIKNKYRFINTFDRINQYSFSKKPFCPPVHKIIKKN